RQLSRGEPGLVAADAAAAGGEDPRRIAGRARGMAPQADARGRSRPSAGAGRGPRAAVGASERGRFPQRRREARAARVRATDGRRTMSRNEVAEGMLAALIAQAAVDGAELVTLRAIAEEASELGAQRALKRIGLADEDAGDDIDKLRELLAAWRAAKASAWKAVLAWIARGALARLLIGIAVRRGVPGVLRWGGARRGPSPGPSPLRRGA